ncbi:DUF1858 domain-containing protein [Bradyrhizobium sp. 186]|uniref:DUF1858 domain-containing protein n=1 Tax=Bradyrhizobium sp. 186 TaxID=2782654 RepID=UPI00206AD7DA|nr:DUF1858 domain-containing protein [Bradyrhizobium sp. 186]UPK37073.1 DUF1858 domain-containing protein [Bradyrhizobium sp. 186]
MTSAACASTKRLTGVSLSSLRNGVVHAFRSDDLVDDIMRTAPHTIRVFLAFRMACVGCPIATFHTVEDACREHGIDRKKFLAALCDCVPA